MVGFGQRFIGSLLNWLINFTIIGAIINFVFIVNDGQTIGGKVMGYKYTESGIGFALKLWLAVFVAGLWWFGTFGIGFIIDFLKFDENKGWMWEKWFSISKVNA